MGKRTKYIMLFAVLGILVVAVSFFDFGEKTANLTVDESERNIRGFINETLAGPNEDLIEIWEVYPKLDKDNMEEFEKQLQNYNKKLEKYLEENLKPFISERSYNVGGNYDFLKQAHSNGYKLNVQDITVEESEKTEDSYNITAEIDYTKEGNKDPNTITLRGLMNTNEEDKVDRIIYHNYQELDVALGQHLSTIERVLRREFNGPDEELKEIFQGLQSGEETELYAQKFDQYMDRYINPVYNLSDQSIEEIGLQYLDQAYQNGYELKTENINVEKSEENLSAYRFTVEVAYAKRELKIGEPSH